VDAHAPEESDRAIVSMNQTNKEERSSAEPGEKRAWAKENIVQSNTNPTQCGGLSVPRIERCASRSTFRQSSKVGAVCGNAARTVLCGGRSAMVVPTASLTSWLTQFQRSVSLKRQSGDLKLLSPCGRVLRVLTLFRLLDRIPSFEDEAQALGSFRPRGYAATS
jgi:hypothetical protein